MSVKYYQELIVWQKAMRLAREVYTIARQLPAEEKFALADQIRRSNTKVSRVYSFQYCRRAIKGNE